MVSTMVAGSVSAVNSARSSDSTALDLEVAAEACPTSSKPWCPRVSAIMLICRVRWARRSASCCSRFWELKINRPSTIASTAAMRARRLNGIGIERYPDAIECRRVPTRSRPRRTAMWMQTEVGVPIRRITNRANLSPAERSPMMARLDLGDRVDVALLQLWTAPGAACPEMGLLLHASSWRPCGHAQATRCVSRLSSVPPQAVSVPAWRSRPRRSSACPQDVPWRRRLSWTAPICLSPPCPKSRPADPRRCGAAPP